MKSALPDNALSDEIKIYAAMMCITADVFNRKITDKNSSDFLHDVKALVAFFGPIITEHGGYYAGVFAEGIIAVFEDSCEDALKCAVTICQSSLNSEKDRSYLKNTTIGINFGHITRSLLIYGDFSMPMLLSSVKSSAVMLSKTAPSFSARILIAHSAAERIRDFTGRFNVRRLGLGGSAIGKRDEMIYDVYDGDGTAQKYSKRRSKLFFESGVDLFIQGSYLQARSRFIELLKFDRNDNAAKQYIYICDKYISDPKGSDECKYIVVY